MVTLSLTVTQNISGSVFVNKKSYKRKKGFWQVIFDVDSHKENI